VNKKKLLIACAIFSIFQYVFSDNLTYVENFTGEVIEVSNPGIAISSPSWSMSSMLINQPITQTVTDFSITLSNITANKAYTVTAKNGASSTWSGLKCFEFNNGTVQKFVDLTSTNATTLFSGTYSSGAQPSLTGLTLSFPQYVDDNPANSTNYPTTAGDFTGQLVFTVTVS